MIQPEATGAEEGAEAPVGSKSGKRVKYVCPVCQLSALAKHDARLACLEHGVQMLPAD